MQEVPQLDRTTRFLIFILRFVSWAMIALCAGGFTFGLIHFIIESNEISISDFKSGLIIAISAIVGGVFSFFIIRERLKNPQNYKNRNIFRI